LVIGSKRCKIMKSFNLEKSWRSSGTGNTTFNATGNFTVPFGKSVIGITGRGGTGNPGSYSPGGTNSPFYLAGNPGNPNPGGSNPPNAGSFTAGFSNPPGEGTYTAGDPPGLGAYTPGNPNPGGSNPGEYVPGYVDPSYGYGYSGFYIGGNPNPGGENPGSFTPGPPGNPPSYTPGPPGNLNPGSFTPGNPGNPNPPGSNPPNASWYVAGNYDDPSYSPGTPGTPTTVLGVYFPGGASGTASVIPLTTVNANAYTWPSSYPVTVPSGGYITIQLL
jgi:hypothetical protein